MGIISQWRSFAWEHPAKALLLTIIPLAFLMLLGNSFNSAVYDNATPRGVGRNYYCTLPGASSVSGPHYSSQSRKPRPCSGLRGGDLAVASHAYGRL